MASLAYFVERESRPPLTLSVVSWMFLLALLGLFVGENLLYCSLEYFSSASQTAINNLFPSFTYIISIISRQEKAVLLELRGIGKLLGTLIALSGAFTLNFWPSDSTFSIIPLSANTAVGYIFATLGCLSYSFWIILQGPVLTRYPAELSLTAMVFFFGTVQSTVVAIFVCPDISQWKLNSNLEIINICLGGALNFGIGIYCYTFCARKKGALFTAAFSPLSLLLTAVIQKIILGTIMTIGSIMGSVLIVGGLYLFLWSKSMEDSIEAYDTQTGVDSSHPNFQYETIFSG